ncbi:hypothetical protein [Pseudomonas chlororaphis]|uniref:hypothetical protein n=1 Tax=Pseudomonas chlororaphis TaxID=587753 RepID=UPI0006A594FF|nr:hypothetical protein [Pseudomonas chlororaphis]AZD01808.1 hypothetical protein C4K27_2614 [Pseudomonas chlororaphis subsp. chlororaphis]MBM0282996.1 hypothetical protein [Pseudomonas chlororaphis]MDO1507275.1 hypothetical protein [Pseudomonas chlororaphis]ORM45435.1 hypothetical protein B6D51_25650 [Pseudomonas chlororaphis subsp. chlororaphis]TWR98679.1 hypothetical protein FJD36_01570 [Pseudomonas chlororaphis subsp. chlororaphis]
MTLGPFTRKTLASLLLMAFGGWIVWLWLTLAGPTAGMSRFKTLEPLSIEGQTAAALPAGTVLYYDTGFAEGHGRYLVYFYHKGVIAQEALPKAFWPGQERISPLWLWNIDPEQVPDKTMTREDIVAAIQAGQLSRQELAAILQSLPR